MTSDLDNLAIHSEYNGIEEVTTINGNPIRISHTGCSSMSLNGVTVSLNDVLCVPSTCQNLLSVHSFIKHNNVSIEFFANYFLVKDLSTGKILKKEEIRDKIYYLSLTPSSSHPIKAFTVIALHTWHQRLGHANLRVFLQILRNNNISFSQSKESSLCRGCTVGKIHKLPFPISSFKATRPFGISG